MSRGATPQTAHPVTDTMRAAHRLWSEGATKAALSRLYGVNVTTIREWIERVIDAQNLDAINGR